MGRKRKVVAEEDAAPAGMLQLPTALDGSHSDEDAEEEAGEAEDDEEDSLGDFGESGEEDDDQPLWARTNEPKVFQRRQYYRSAYDFGLPEEDRYVEPPMSNNLASESSEEDGDDTHSRNTLGNIPLEWYEDYDHMGYDLEGKPIAKGAKLNTIDDYIARSDDPTYWRTVYNKLTDSSITLTPEEMAMIGKMQAGQIANLDFDPYEQWVDFFDYKDGAHPLRTITEPKRRFVPSKWEAKKVAKYVKAIREGRVKKPEPKVEAEVYDLWAEEDPNAYRHFIAPPKMKLPTNSESYNPPGEYLLDDKEKQKWEDLDPEDRPTDYIPQKFDALRKVPYYKPFMKERFERCLDLYLCPRVRKRRMNVDPKSLIPQLPKPKELRPFPTQLTMTYLGHTDRVRCISVHTSGQWLISGSSDQTCRLWEVDSGRCIKMWKFDGVVEAIAWQPGTSAGIFCVAVENRLLFVDPDIASTEVSERLNELFSVEDPPEKAVEGKRKIKDIEWRRPTPEERARGIRLCIQHIHPVRDITFHHKGDYFATVAPEADSRSVQIHQLSKRSTQNPFKRSKGKVQRVIFHPSRPFFFVATQRYVRVYNLVKQQLTKKLMTNCKWVSSIAVHPGGDNVVLGSFDKRVCWMDMDLSDKPYKVMRYHKMAVRAVSISERYPLFASCSDDGTVQVFHGRVYNDLLENPLIVPVKILRGHKVTSGLGVLDVKFHPTQPWVFSSGADGKVCLFT